VNTNLIKTKELKYAQDIINRWMFKNCTVKDNIYEIINTTYKDIVATFKLECTGVPLELQNIFTAYEYNYDSIFNQLKKSLFLKKDVTRNIGNFYITGETSADILCDRKDISNTLEFEMSAICQNTDEKDAIREIFNAKALEFCSSLEGRLMVNNTQNTSEQKCLFKLDDKVEQKLKSFLVKKGVPHGNDISINMKDLNVSTIKNNYHVIYRYYYTFKCSKTVQYVFTVLSIHIRLFSDNPREASKICAIPKTIQKVIKAYSFTIQTPESILNDLFIRYARDYLKYPTYGLLNVNLEKIAEVLDYMEKNKSSIWYGSINNSLPSQTRTYLLKKTESNTNSIIIKNLIKNRELIYPYLVISFLYNMISKSDIRVKFTQKVSKSDIKVKFTQKVLDENSEVFQPLNLIHIRLENIIDILRNLKFGISMEKELSVAAGAISSTMKTNIDIIYRLLYLASPIQFTKNIYLEKMYTDCGLVVYDNYDHLKCLSDVSQDTTDLRKESTWYRILSTLGIR